MASLFYGEAAFRRHRPDFGWWDSLGLIEPRLWAATFWLMLLVSSQYPLVNIQIAIENGPVEIVDFPMKNGWIFPVRKMLVSSPGRVAMGWQVTLATMQKQKRIESMDMYPILWKAKSRILKLAGIYWLVLWNMNFMTFHEYWECHNPKWLKPPTSLHKNRQILQGLLNVP